MYEYNIEICPKCGCLITIGIDFQNPANELKACINPFCGWKNYISIIQTAGNTNDSGVAYLENEGVA